MIISIFMLRRIHYKLFGIKEKYIRVLLISLEIVFEGFL